MEVEVAEKKVWIPVITDERLMELFQRIKPICRFQGEPRYIKPVDGVPESSEYLRRVDYIRYPVAGNKVEGLVPLVDIRTCHSIGRYKMFQASVEEVLAQIPEEHLDQVVAFEIIYWPKATTKMNEELEALLSTGYHAATTQLYRKA